MAGPPRTRRSDPPGLTIQVAPARRAHGTTTGRDVPWEGLAGAEEFRWNFQSPGYGVRSRSRFLPPPTGVNLVDGHDGDVSGVRPAAPPFDPAAGRTQFGPQHYPRSMGEGADRSPNELSLGVETVRMLRSGLIEQDRRSWEPQWGDGTRPVDPIRWGDGPHANTYRYLYSGLRREAYQGAQTYAGGGGFRHSRVVPGAKYSSYPRRMGAPRVYRLTERVTPSSFGAKTQVLGKGPGTVRAQAGPARSQVNPRNIPPITGRR